MFPPCVQNIHHNLSPPATSLLMSSTGEDEIKLSGEGYRDKPKDKGQHEKEKGETRQTVER